MRQAHNFITTGLKKRNNPTKDLTYKLFAFKVASSDYVSRKMTLTSYTKHWGSWAQMGQMIGWGRGSAQNASRFNAMARDVMAEGATWLI